MVSRYEQVEILVFDKADEYAMEGADPTASLGELLSRYGCLLIGAADPDLYATPWGELTAKYRSAGLFGLHRPPGWASGGPAAAAQAAQSQSQSSQSPSPSQAPQSPPPKAWSGWIGAEAGPGQTAAPHATAPGRPLNQPLSRPLSRSPNEPPAVPLPPYPRELTDREAVITVYGATADAAAAQLRARNCVLITCEKLVVAHLWQEIAKRAELQPLNPFHAASELARQAADSALPPLNQGDDAFVTQLEARLGGSRAQLMQEVRRNIQDAGPGEVVVLPHLDLFVGTARMEQSLSDEAREFADLLYPTAPRGGDRPLLLAFADPSLTLPEVVTQLFVPLSAEGCERLVPVDGRPVPLCRTLVLEEERATFNVDEHEFFKHVAGMNPVRVRQAMRYANSRFRGGSATMLDLRDALRDFKNSSAAGFQPPTETFDDIGGYQPVKDQLDEAVRLIVESQGPQAAAYRGLAPRGFIFHGPPGTGKTLFAKAVAHELEASLMVVSGPEVNGRWFGQSESRIRELFAQARRNAPSVLVFDEFDAIARARSDQGDGGSRAGNAVVAQILTEMDGFRPDVIMLVIATTNRKDDLDPALLRPSRFHAVEIDLPDPEARGKILSHYNGKHGTGLEPELLAALVAYTGGWNGDMLQEIFRQAHRNKLLKPGWQPGPEEIAEIAGRIGQTKPKGPEGRR